MPLENRPLTLDIYDYLFRYSLDFIAIVDFSGRTIDVNPSYQKAFGYSREELITKPYRDFVHPEDLASLEQTLKRLAEGESVVNYEVQLLCKDGSYKKTSWNAATSPDKSLIFGIGHDITESSKITEMRTEMISFVSHQLKTPVAELKGFIDNMLAGLAGELTPKQSDYLKMMQKISARNYQLVYNLLNVSRIEQGQLSFDLQPTELREVVDYAIADFIHAAELKGLKLSVEEQDKKVIVGAALDKTIEALRNIIDNAIRFTDKGSVTIRIKREDGYGVIEVEDTGEGIPETLLPKLFTKEFMLTPATRPRGGFGLGLYIAYCFITMQHGKLSVQSTVGKGTIFTIQLPEWVKK